MSPILVLAILILGVFVYKSGFIARYRSQMLLGAAAALILWLVVTGKLHALFALVAAVLPMIQRFAGLLQWIPGIKKLFEQANPGASAPPSRADGKLTREQAAEILGVSPDASAKEIREAHRKLMGKLHPDKGGNDFLASQLNNARDTLL